MVQGRDGVALGQPNPQVFPQDAAPTSFFGWLASLKPSQRCAVCKLYQDSVPVHVQVRTMSASQHAILPSLWPLYPATWASGPWWARHLRCELPKNILEKERELGHLINNPDDRPKWVVTFQVRSETDRTIIIDEDADNGAYGGAQGQHSVAFQLHQVLQSSAPPDVNVDEQWAQLQRLVETAFLMVNGEGGVPRVSFEVEADTLAFIGAFPHFNPFGSEFAPNGGRDVTDRLLDPAEDSVVTHTCGWIGCVKSMHMINESTTTKQARLGCPGTVLIVWEGIIVDFEPCPHAWRSNEERFKRKMVHHTACAVVVVRPFEPPEGFQIPQDWLGAREIRARNMHQLNRLATKAEYWGRILAEKAFGLVADFKLPTDPS